MRFSSTRISTRAEFKEVFKKGRFFEEKYYKFFITASANFKFAVVVSKKVGNAVTRNLIKRRIRNIVWPHYKTGKFKFVIITRPGIENIKFSILEKQIKNIVEIYEKNISIAD